MQCRTIKTHYDSTVSFNHKTLTEWAKDKLPMVVIDIATKKTLGILTWDWFTANHGESFKKHDGRKKFRIQVSTFLAVKPMPQRTHILRKARS